MWIAEISDKVSLPDLVVLSVALAIAAGLMCWGTWISRVVAMILVVLWDLAMLSELSDASFVAVARLEFGYRYEVSLVAAGLIPLLSIVGVTTAAMIRKRGATTLLQSSKGLPLSQSR